MEYRTKSNNKICYLLYFKPDLQYRLEMVGDTVYFVFAREQDNIEDLLLDFNCMKDNKISSYVDLGTWLNLQITIRTLIKNYKDRKAESRNDNTI